MSRDGELTIDVAVIGGTGVYRLAALADVEEVVVDTPFGELSAPVVVGNLGKLAIAFVARHGTGHTMLPHRINYRANVHALAGLKPRCVVAINAVGSMDERLPPGALGLPDQIIDYTWGRAGTFHGELEGVPMHVDLTEPYDAGTRQALRVAGGDQLAATEELVYGCTQGPRLETAAEVHRMIRDGCHVVGMTGMPEAALARELGLPYASLCVVANWAAGFRPDVGEITMEEVLANIESATGRVIEVLQGLG